MLENISSALRSVWAHKIRSFLTILGIIIGIASIITIVSTIKGTNDQIKQNLIGSGVNAVVVSLYQDDYTYDMQYSPLPDGVSVIDEETREKILELDNVKDVSLFRSRNYSENVFYKNTSYTGSLYGVDDHYFDIYGYRLSLGRNFLKEDHDSLRKVVILDGMANNNLFSGKNPIGETVEISSEPFTVIGVVEQASSFTPVINSMNDYYMYMNTEGGKIFIPTETWPTVYRFDEPQSVAVKTASTDDMTKAGQQTADLLTKSQIRGDTFSYRSQDLLEQAKRLQELSNSTNNQLLWIAGISLVVGGIGVMNIMLVTVTERTREIGLKKAIGAKKKRILYQFLTEAAVLTSMGGVLGVIVGIVLAKLMAYFMQIPTAISVPAILVAVIFSMVIGILFGLIPAVKASNLNPIDALRRE
ncbi:MAG: ABC transporter permease [Oscillospiraceae bacterium]|nr:ABC transporter permease [Oscillospiraceae bacterium]